MYGRDSVGTAPVSAADAEELLLCPVDGGIVPVSVSGYHHLSSILVPGESGAYEAGDHLSGESVD